MSHFQDLGARVPKDPQVGEGRVRTAPSASHLDADRRGSACSAAVWPESRGAARSQMYNISPEKGVHIVNIANPEWEWGAETVRDCEICTVSAMC